MSRLTLLMIITVASPVCAQSSKLVKAAAPAPATIAGYDRGHCVALANRVRVCKLLSESKDTFLVEKEGKSVGTWPGSTFMAETSDFEVLTGDLDGDRRAELIVANHDSTSNGMAVDYWTIHIFPDIEFQTFQPPLKFSVQEYGSLGTFVTSRGTVNILTTTWVSARDPKGKRDWGTYLVGHWWRYQSGKIVPLSNRPLVARRYLRRFERERFDAVEPARVPFRWLNHADSEPVNTDFITGAERSVKAGVIEAVSNEAETGHLKIVFKPDGEPALTYLYGVDYEKNSLRFIGDATSGRVYPDHYQPTSPETWLAGKRARLRSYGDDTRMQILWLER